MDVDDLLKVSDERNDGSSENNGLTVEIDEADNKAVMAASRSSDTTSGALPAFSLDGIDEEVGPNTPEDEKDGPGDDKPNESKPEQTTAANTDDTKVSTQVKIGDITLDVKVGGKVVYGRESGVTEPNVSRRHAEIGRDGKGLYVIDLGSTNGTYVTRDGKREQIPAHTKVYVADLSKVEFSKDGPSMAGGKPEKVAAPPPPAKEGDTVVAKAPPDVRPVPEIGGQGVTNPDRIQRELTHAKMTGKPELVSSDGEREVYRAKVTIDGREREVVLRHTNNRDAADQARKELAAYELSKFLGVADTFPATSVREFEVNGVKKLGTIQLADQGKNLESQLREMAQKKYGDNSEESVKKLIAENPKLKAAIEKAVAERVIFGDKAFEAKDFTLREVNGEFSVLNKGIERGFETAPNPAMESKPGDKMSATVQDAFSGKEITPEVRAKVVEFLGKYNNKGGYEQLTELGLSEKEIDHMMARAKVIAEGGKFPVAEVKAPGAATSDTKASPSLMFNLSLSRRTMPAELEFKTKEQVAAHMERVLAKREEDKKFTATADNRTEFKQLIEAYKQGDPNAVKLVHAELALTFQVEPPSSAVVDNAAAKDLERSTLSPEQKSAASERLIAKGTLRTLLGEAGVSEDKAKQLERDLLSKDKEAQLKARDEVEKAYKSAGKTGGYRAFLSDVKGRASAVAIVAGPVIAALLPENN